MKSKIFDDSQGFALLYAILLTGTVLVVGVLLMNIITKQLIYSSIGKNSETAYYYVANSIRECIGYNEYQNNSFTSWGQDNDGNDVADFVTAASFGCPGANFNFSNPTSISNNIYKYSLVGQSVIIGGNNYQVDVDVYKNYICEVESCSSTTGTNLYDKYSTVIIVSGYSQSGPREVKRTAVLVR